LFKCFLIPFFAQEKADDPSNQLFVFFPEDEKLGVKPIKIYTDRMRAENVGNAIIGKCIIY
jgi:DNA-directed RNA polymerase I, II, and III subunit RPABC1